jgi:hypothetical protein
MSAVSAVTTELLRLTVCLLGLLWPFAVNPHRELRVSADAREAAEAARYCIRRGHPFD